MSEDSERKFLHDIASPVGTALFILDMMVETLQECSDTNPKDLVQAKQLYELMKRMKKMIEERRSVLIQNDPKSKAA